MGQHEDHGELSDRRDADRGSHVVREDEEGDAKGHDTFVGGHAVHHGSHGVLAHSVVNVAAGRVFGGERLHVALVLGRRLEIRGAADQLRDGVRQHARDLAGRLDV